MTTQTKSESHGPSSSSDEPSEQRSPGDLDREGGSGVAREGGVHESAGRGRAHEVEAPEVEAPEGESPEHELGGDEPVQRRRRGKGRESADRASAEFADADWVPAGDGYTVALVPPAQLSGGLAFRNPRGKVLKAVPGELRRSAAAEQLLELRSWLEGRTAQCRALGERLLLLSPAIAAPTLTTLWRDPDWQGALRHLLVRIDAPEDPLFAPDSGMGFLLGADPDDGIGLIDAEGGEVWFHATQVQPLHPLAVPELDNWKELAGALRIAQGVAQLSRTLTPRPDRMPKGKRHPDFRDALFSKVVDLRERVKRMGYDEERGLAVCPLREDGALVEARFELGIDDDAGRAVTGDLYFAGAGGETLPLADVGPIAWSEGVRMASSIASGGRRSKRGASGRRA